MTPWKVHFCQLGNTRLSESWGRRSLDKDESCTLHHACLFHCQLLKRQNVTLSHHCDYHDSCVTKIRNKVGIKLRGSVEGGGGREGGSELL